MVKKPTPQPLAHLEELSFDELLSILMAADDMYYSQDGESSITDEQYDILRQYAHGLNPNHTYFLGVGSAVRGGKVKLPFVMGGLDQIYKGEIEKWIDKWNLQEQFLIATDKLDGKSALLIYNENGDFQIAFSRGDGINGADITRIIRHLPSIPKNISRSMVIRGEIIIKKSNWEQVRSIAKTKGGTPYKNPRNCVAGLMNSKTINDQLYPLIDFIAYEIIGYSDSKTNMLWELEDAGFVIPHYDSLGLGKELTDMLLTDFLTKCREVSEYEIDGIVLDVNDAVKRSQIKPTRDTLNPAYAVKYKVADESNQANTTVREVQWNVSKDGFLKPTVCIAPVELLGVTIQHATGFNAKFIHDNHVGPGARVSITRSGDVTPFIQSVVEGTKAQMPDECEWIWNETEVDVVLVDHHEYEEVIIQQVLAYCQSINAPMLKEGNIRTMFRLHNYESFTHAVLFMSNYVEDHWFSCIGANGRKIYNGLRKIYSGIPLYVLMGATPFFGRGVGVRKFKKLLKDLKVRSVNELPCLNKAQIVSVEGFEDKTATKIVTGMDDFLYFMQRINGLRVLVEVGNTDGVMKDQKVVFTGFRNKELQSLVESEDGTMQSGVSSKTTIVVAKNPNDNSGKLKKAREKGIHIMGIEEFKELLN